MELLKNKKYKTRVYKNGHPKGMLGKHHTKETKEKIRQANLGKIVSKETRKKMSEWQKGEKSYMFGRKLSEETKRKKRKAMLGKRNPMFGKKRSKAMRKKISKFTKIAMNNLEVKEKMSKFNSGRNNPMWGKHHSKESKKKISEAQKGEKGNNWHGGKSFEPYGLEFNKDLKEVIRNRDRRKCQICGKTELKNKKKLSVHHIDYNKKNNNPNNLISLCEKCHIKTNWKRKYWTNYFIKNIK